MYQKSCEEFIEALHSKEPVPGGGGASALIGAVGTALGGMVLNLTAGRKNNTPEEEAFLASCIKEAKELEQRFLELINEDARCFIPLSEAYKLPKNTEEEKNTRSLVMEAALATACEAPLAIMNACLDSVILLEKCLSHGTKLAISDAGAGAAAIEAAGKGAVLNIRINAGMMKSEESKEAYLTQADLLLETICTHSEKIYQQVTERISH